MFKKISNILLIVIVVIITVISMTNLHSVTFKVLFFSFEIPLTVLFYLLLVTGFIAGYITKGITGYRKSRKVKTENEPVKPKKHGKNAIYS